MFQQKNMWNHQSEDALCQREECQQDIVLRTFPHGLPKAHEDAVNTQQRHSRHGHQHHYQTLVACWSPALKKVVRLGEKSISSPKTIKQSVKAYG